MRSLMMPGARQLLQVQARLAEFDALALDVADAEALADQVVEPAAAHYDLAAGPRAGQADVFDGLGLDQGQRLPRAGPVGEEVAVTLQAVTGHRADGADRSQRVAGADVDGLDMHAIHHPGRSAWRQASYRAGPARGGVRRLCCRDLKRPARSVAAGTISARYPRPGTLTDGTHRCPFGKNQIIPNGRGFVLPSRLRTWPGMIGT